MHITKPYDIILSVKYRPPDSSPIEFIDNFTAHIDHISRLSSSKTEFLFMGDFNIDLMNTKSFQVNNFVNLMYSRNCCANIIFPTRITSYSATLIDNIFGSDCHLLSGLIYSDISNHLPIFSFFESTVKQVIINDCNIMIIIDFSRQELTH